MSNYLVLASRVAVTAPGVVPGSTQPTAVLDPADYTLVFDAQLTAARARVGIEDSPDGTTWTPLYVWTVGGPTTQQDSKLREYRIPGLKTGAGAQVRLNVYEIVGGLATLNIGFQY